MLIGVCNEWQKKYRFVFYTHLLKYFDLEFIDRDIKIFYEDKE